MITMPNSERLRIAMATFARRAQAFDERSEKFIGKLQVIRVVGIETAEGAASDGGRCNR